MLTFPQALSLEGWDNRLHAATEEKMSQEFHRIKRLPPYVFEHINPLKAKARAEGVDIIDLGMGNPDLPTPEHIVEKLKETVMDPRTHRYSSSKGIPGLRKAQASYYGRRFGVKLNPDTQVVATLGSKEGFANMAQAITAPGDVVLVPNPTYPIHSFGFIMSGGVVRSMPAEPSEDFLRVLDRAVRHSIPKPIALILNYPSNPTAYVATLDWYKEVVKYCKEQEIFILSDLAYSEIYFDMPPPPSILEVPEAMDIAVEFTSMSKTYSMPGWRMGFAVGNEKLISALSRVKSYLDYGAFTPIQVAAAAALNGPDDCIEEARKIYHTRRDVMVESFGRAGWELPAPPATMFVWAPIPPQFAHLGSLEFAKLLISETGVAVAPGVGFGEYGDQYVRLALVENEQRIRQAARALKKFFAKHADGKGNVVELKGR
jgi:alanine-synthesizing transaminase